MSAANPLPPAELITKAQQGSKAAMSRLIGLSMWIVTAQVRKWAQVMPDEDRDDLTQVALAGAARKGLCLGGLMRAIETYDATKGNNFWTHCTTWVIAEMRRTYAAKQREARRMPGFAVEVQLHDAHNGSKGHDSTERLAEGNNGRVGHDAVQLPSPDDPEATVAARESLEKLSRMPQRLRTALAMRVGEEEFADIGEELGVSREWARSLYRKAQRHARLAVLGPRMARK